MDQAMIEGAFVKFNADDLDANQARELSIHLCDSASVCSNIDNEFVDRLTTLTEKWPPDLLAQLKQLVSDWSNVKNQVVRASATQIRYIVGEALLPEPTKPTQQ